ncbi:hypothetical protein [Candidatus Nitrosotenuis uzonensis]|uniref:Uncharacterized protein n=1 Tax=Candidatus Nitrosotenuis uzonensis TaxID=1407055 RepID=V6ATB4_9ARCH|nr:hypothetical protein [Candidatus Nitrosotenuis uzonensis]CDI05892.1 hypothetical protein NITUZ_40058 [Candidatus Nitrosotenuis uzonensis]
MSKEKHDDKHPDLFFTELKKESEKINEFAKRQKELKQKHIQSMR